MFEFEAGVRAPSASRSLSGSVLRMFSITPSVIEASALLQWEEHCTECAMPACFASCELYVPRKDGRCRRFAGGFEYIDTLPHALGHVARVRFKRWGRMYASTDLGMLAAPRARALERWLTLASRAAGRIPDRHLRLAGRAGPSSRLVRRLKAQARRSASLAPSASRNPTAFVVDVYNPASEPVELSLVVRSRCEAHWARPYQEVIHLRPGLTRHRTPYERIAPHVAPSGKVDITIGPSTEPRDDSGVELYFGIATFVHERFAIGKQEPHYQPGALTGGLKHVKVVAWDLDHTLWDGVLIEDGFEKLRIRPEAVRTILALDARGIVNSIVSKNNPEDVRAVLEKLGVDGLFAFPQVSWMPKSQGIATLARELGIGIDTVAFVDDSAFERFEVAHVHPSVRTYDARELVSLPDLPELRPPLSPESHTRRESYKAEETRRSVRNGHQGSYEDFLRHCGLRIVVDPAAPATLARSHELVQRTNQMNFSGGRYTYEQLAEMVSRPNLLGLNLRCADRFGDYGIVGFCLVDTQRSCIRDLMFSCRIQAKRVEHDFLVALALHLRSLGRRELTAAVQPTARNAMALRVFEDLGFERHQSEDARTLYRLPLSNIPDWKPTSDVVWNVPENNIPAARLREAAQ